MEINVAERQSLKAALASIEKDLGTSVQMLGEMAPLQVEAIRSGSFLLDAAIGVGGYPRGRIIEVFGAPSGGKTTMSLIAIAQAQKAGGRAAFIDVEHAFSVEYAQSMGIDTDKLYFVQPDFGEQALEILERLTATNEYDIIVLDSTAALLPKAEMEEEVGKQFMALQARMMSQALRKLTPVVGKTKTVVIFINQTRQNVGVMYGNPTTTPGGEALKFYSSVRLNVRRTGGSDIKDGKDILGHRINITCVKNKVAPPLKSAELTFVYGKGIDTVLDMLEYATDKGILTVTGHTYSLGTNKWVGRDNAIKAIQEDPALTKQVEELLLAATSPKA
jgi:recombination protein RecA